jgi:hypothetical protein
MVDAERLPDLGHQVSRSRHPPACVGTALIDRRFRGGSGTKPRRLLARWHP